MLTLEQIENDFLPLHERQAQEEQEEEGAPLPKKEQPESDGNDASAEEQKDGTQPADKTDSRQLASKYVEIRANQSNVSYKKLFGDYLATASHIVITDPYIRVPFQVDNLVEFIQTCRDCCEKNEELYIELHTQNTDEKIPEMIDTFDDIKDELQAVGIDFNYFFDADHDRNICLDNGWKIVLSRGLDIFEKYGRFSLGSVRQTNRRCREFSVTFVQE